MNLRIKLEFVQFCSTKFGKFAKMIRTDRGGEYQVKGLESFFKRNGIEHQTTAWYSPQQNGIAERKNRSLTEMAQCMLIDADLANQFWGEAVMTVTYLQNRLPTRAIEKTPHEAWYGKQPDQKHVRTFGCKAFKHVPDELRHKLDNSH